MGYQEYYQQQPEKSTGSNRKKSWWEEEQDLIDEWDDSSYRGRSVSSRDDFLGYHAWGERSWGGDPKHAKLSKVTTEIARLMNTVLNSRRGQQEKALTIAWADKAKPDPAAQNNPQTNTVTLNPDIVIGKGGTADNSTNPAIVDGLGGQVLMGSTLKRTMSLRAWSSAQEDQSPEAKANRAIWEAVETAKAKQSLLTEWPGFAPYLKRHQSLTTTEMEEVQQYIDSKPDKLSAAVAATAWTLINPRQPLKLPDKIRDAVDHIADPLDQADSMSRYIAAKNAVSYLRTIFEDDDDRNQQQQQQQQQNQPQPDPNGQGQGQPDPKGKPDNGKGKGKGKGKPKPPSGPPRLTDGSMFGQGVPSSHTGVPGPVNATEDPSNQEHPDAPSGCARYTKVNYVKVNDEPEHKKAYAEIVKTAAPLTRAICSAIQFRKTAPEFPLHGLFSGELDDGSLDKLAFRKEQRPAVFERKEITAIPDVAVEVLVDESSSMGKHLGQTMSRIEAARIVCTALVEAFSKLRGVNVMVLGFYSSGPTVRMTDFVSPQHPTPSRIAAMDDHGFTPTGYALEEGIKRLYQTYPRAKQKYVFMLTDGIPEGCIKDESTGQPCDYGGVPAREHTRNVCTWGLKRFGVRTYGIGIEGKPCQEDGEIMFGKGHFVGLEKTMESARVIASFLARVSAKV